MPDNGNLYWKMAARCRYGNTWIRVVISGCKTENRQFQQTHALLKSMVLDAITAWCVLDQQRRARVESDTPANRVVEPEGLEVGQSAPAA